MKLSEVRSPGGVVAVLVVALLVSANVALYRLPADGPVRAVGHGDDTAAVPPLPEVESRSGTRALADELDRTTGSVARPLEVIRGTLGTMARDTGRLGGLVAEVKALRQDTSSLRRIAPDLARLTEASRRLAGLPDVLKELRPLLAGLTSAARSVAGLGSLGGQVGSLSAQLRGLDGTVAETGAAIRAMRAVLEETNRSLDRLAGCLRTPVVCRR